MKTTKERSRQEEKDILEYVYDEIRVKQSDQVYLHEVWDISDIGRLEELTDEDYNIIEANSGRRLKIKIEWMVEWMRWYKNTIGEVPTTVVEWKLYFDEEAYVKLEIRKVTNEDMAIAQKDEDIAIVEKERNVATEETQKDHCNLSHDQESRDQHPRLCKQENICKEGI